ncbi:MAG: nitric oxide reductase transcriptional regulator NorR [Planctomycetes bacterium]|nr:nitric oxide reductase transcriptional regulator NorR [Planctomycetota bacterium]
MKSTTASDDGDLLLDLALDLTAALSSEDRHRRLVEAVRRMLPCDAAALLRLDGDALVPVATHGLAPETMGRRFARDEHPRLDAICRADGPTAFPPDSALPDPFDGLLLGDADATHHVHACLGAPLRVEGTLVGVLTADAADPRAFEGVDARTFRTLAALAGATMRTSALIDALRSEAQREARVARDLLADDEQRRGGELLGASAAIVRLRDEIALVGATGFPVLVTGETGTGKELVARGLHAASRRADRPLLYVNCAALPESVAESELFGHVRGAFTGADRDRAGKLEVADGGTLLLDEVGELPASVQPKLLRALQSGEIQRVGSDRTLRVDVRILAATNRDLEAEVAAGRFRADLFHRLHVYRIRVPPLRERLDDVPLLAGWFSDATARRLGTGPVRWSAAARAALAGAAWPGTVRELEHRVQAAVLRASAGVRRGDPVVVEARHLGDDLVAPREAASAPETPAGGAAGSGGARTLREATEAFQRRAIATAVAAAGGNWAAAARTLGVHRSNLHHLARRLGIATPGPRR